jgi:diacylglycerol O-acyltransferase-1
LAIVEQYMVPLVHRFLFALQNLMKSSSFRPSQGFDVLVFTERLLKLSVPNLYVWLMGFYVFFHVYLNILAEITRYGDRLFYRDW